jgi:hypothetical protein
MSALRELTEKDKRYFRKLADCSTEEEALCIIDDCVRNGVNFNALTGEGEERQSGLAEALIYTPPWLSVIQKLVASGFDPLVRPLHPYCAPAAIKCICNFSESIPAGSGREPVSGVEYAHLKNVHIDDEGGCSVISVTKYLLDFRPDLSARANGDSDETLSEFFDNEVCFVFDQFKLFFTCAVMETISAILRRAEEGKDYHAVYAYNRVFGQAFKGIAFCPPASSEDAGAPLKRDYENYEGALIVRGRVVLRFEEFDLVFSQNGVPIIDNTLRTEDMPVTVEDNIAGGFVGKRISDIYLYEEAALPDGSLPKDCTTSQRRTVAELIFADGSVMVVKSAWADNLFQTVECQAREEAAENPRGIDGNKNG